MKILLTNDDGIDAPGIAHLYRAIQDLGEVTVIAPSKVQSAMSHAVTFHKPVRVTNPTIQNADAGISYTGHAVDGRPGDCVKLGLNTICPDVDLVISGMNCGANVGVNVTYSGTVGAAREAAFSGVPALAVSLHIGDWDNIQWPKAVDHARATIDKVLQNNITPHTLVNINVPCLDEGDPHGYAVAPLQNTGMVDTYQITEETDGSKTYRINAAMQFKSKDPNTDVAALFDRRITVTPLHFDTSHHDELNRWRNIMSK